MKVCSNRKFLRAENGRDDHVETAPELKLAGDRILFHWGKLREGVSDFFPELKLENRRSISCKLLWLLQFVA